MLNNAFYSCPILKYRQNRNQKRKNETQDTFLGGQIGSFEFFCLLQLKLSQLKNLNKCLFCFLNEFELGTQNKYLCVIYILISDIPVEKIRKCIHFQK